MTSLGAVHNLRRFDRTFNAIVTMTTETRAGSNAKAKRDLSWEPAHSSWRQGFAEVLSQPA
jgi:hypothetical protein